MEPKREQCRYLMDDGGQCPNLVVGTTSFCDQYGCWSSTDIEIFKITTEHFRQDVREF